MTNKYIFSKTRVLIFLLVAAIVGVSFLFADVVKKPDTKRFSSLKANDMEGMIEEGYNAAKLMIPDILKLISVKPKRKTKSPFNQGEGVKVI